MDDTDNRPFPALLANWCSARSRTRRSLRLRGLVSAARPHWSAIWSRAIANSLPLDDDTVLAAARSDPTGLVRALDRTTIDEVQRVPDLLRAIKKSVDDDRRPGRFLLTGSANILTRSEER